jgi:hypothetical protein
MTSKHPKSSASRMKRGKASWARGEHFAIDAEVSRESSSILLGITPPG